MIHSVAAWVLNRYAAVLAVIGCIALKSILTCLQFSIYKRIHYRHRCFMAA